MFLNCTLLYAFVLACGKCHATLLGPILEGRAIYLGLFEARQSIIVSAFTLKNVWEYILYGVSLK